MDKPDKYGRALGDIELMDGGHRLSDYLLTNRLGVVYEGAEQSSSRGGPRREHSYLKTLGGLI